MRVSPPQKRRSAHKQLPSAPFFFPLTLPTMQSQIPTISYHEMKRHIASGNCHALAFTFPVFPKAVDALLSMMLKQQPSLPPSQLMQQTTESILPALVAVQQYKEKAADDRLGMAKVVQLERTAQQNRRLLKAKKHAVTRPYYEPLKGPYTLDLPED
jgi:hypothetical protein